MRFSSTECKIWFSAAVAESVAVGMVNLVTIVVFIKNRNLRKRSMCLILNLAVADMLVGGLSTIHFFSLLRFYCGHEKWIYRQSLGTNTLTFLFCFFPLSSITGIAIISLERMHATFRPFKHRLIKKWVYGVTTFFVWIVSAAMSTTLVVFYLKGDNDTSHYLWQSFNLICLFIICVSYAAIVVKMYCGAHPQHSGAASRERKLTMILFIMTVVSLLVYLPFTISTFIFFTTDLLTSIPLITLRLNYSLILLVYANSLVNPFLYTIRMPEFKRALSSVCRRQETQVEVFALRPI